MFAIYDLSNGSWDGIESTDDGHDPLTEGVRPVPVGYPALYTWSPALPGFVPIGLGALSRLSYQRLFTQSERIAIRASFDPIVVDCRELAALAETIDLTDADVVAGTQYLEAIGLIGGGRADQILAGQMPA